MMQEHPGSGLRAQLAGLRAQLRDDVTAVEDLRAVRDRRAELDVLLVDLDRQMERVERAAVITLVGATGAGKSTLLNALAGSRIAVEGLDRPTTRQPVIYAPRDADVSELVGPEIDRPGGHESEGGPRVVRYTAASGPWTAQILIDAPDMNSVDEQHRATVTALAERSDVLVVVLHRQSILEERSVSFLDAFAARRQLVFVLNRADELTAESRASLLAQVHQLAAERWRAPRAPVLALSARAAQSQPNAEGWADFCHALRELVRDSAITGVRRLNAVGTAAHITRLFGAVRAAIEEDFAALPADADAGLMALIDKVADEVAARLELRRPDLAALLWGEAAKRWDGPGGWALRSGGVGSLGLGSAAALVTRNPLLAAGAAATALAADQVEKALRDRRVTATAGLMPSSGEFAAWYTESLATARVRAGRLVGTPEALGLPDAEAARFEVTQAVDESWSALLERDLPAAAARSVLRFFRLLLDLPVYALAAWVLYKVGSGFFAGTYAGVDFLLNAALILAAYLFAVRFAVRGALSRRAGGLLAEVIERTRAAVVRQADAIRAGIERAHEERRAALDRLTRLEDRWRGGLRL